jgi:hypothetical protein
MNRELLEALGAVAADVYVDAMQRHPGLFHITGVDGVNDEDLAVWMVLMCLDELFPLLSQALEPSAPIPAGDEELPF